ncbi:MAG: LemA family protein [Methylotenera sp.]|uniref:LemA family protein n=1 Tax=Methylotenera sp. TaxID=2051956 RepID=UPI00248A3E7A|nr:LemA family protein [Methylotenera sp.]MDI1308198.1 LemA family protein [Methylotenera sp.]
MIVWVIVAVVAVYFAMTYNSLVSIKNNVEKAWANIDVLLIQRNEELPKLIDTCKAYMTHEAQTLERVIQARMGLDVARQMHDVAGLSKAESALSSSLGGLFAVAENYPDLKADQTFINLQQRITGLENQIADRREFYNDSVNNNNVRIKQFPDVIVAGLFGFERAEMLKFSHAELEDVDVSARFKI